jgi:hypothetical protein
MIATGDRVRRHGLFGLFVSVPFRLVAAPFLCFLVPFTDLKFGPVQISELLCVFVLLLYFTLRRVGGIRFSVKCRWNWFVLLFFLICCISSIVAYWGERFYVPSDANSLLKSPGWISASRVMQFFLVYFVSCVVVSECKKSSVVYGWCVRSYISAATVSAGFGVCSYFLMLVGGPDLGGAYGDDGLRLRSFFVEGGPYGLFCGSAMLLCLSQWSSGRAWRWPNRLIFLLLVVSFLLAQSKSATFAILVVLLVSFFAGDWRAYLKYFPIIFSLLLAIFASAYITGADGVFGRILDRKDVLLESPGEFVGDNNVMMGRIAGSIIVPEMVRAHPFIGVGLGNYSLLRDSAEYNPYLPAVDLWDLHGLGLYGFSAEVGVFGVLTLGLFFCWPIRKIYLQSKGRLFTLALSFYPLAALIFGVQPTFSYPWILLALLVSTPDELNKDGVSL